MSTIRVLLKASLVALAALVVSPVQADPVVANGVTYSLSSQLKGNGAVMEFTLWITGINGSADTEKGRAGVEAIAFSKPTGFQSAELIIPPGWTTYNGGLAASGCGGEGDDFCFGNPSVSHNLSTPLAANSELQFVFRVAAGSFAGWTPELHIDWYGRNGTYGDVGAPLSYACTGCGFGARVLAVAPAAVVPEPSMLALVALGLLLIGGVAQVRRKAAAR
jgi:hypothetical protein